MGASFSGQILRKVICNQEMGGQKSCTGGYEELYPFLIESTGYVAPPSKAYSIT